LVNVVSGFMITFSCCSDEILVISHELHCSHVC